MSTGTILILVFGVAMVALHLRGHRSHVGHAGGCGGNRAVNSEAAQRVDSADCPRERRRRPRVSALPLPRG